MTAEGARVARLAGRHPGAESDYILGNVSWLRGREYELFDRDDRSVPYLGGPLPTNELYSPLPPPRHDMLAIELILEAESQPQQPGDGPAQPPKPKVAAYSDPIWHVAAGDVEVVIDDWTTTTLALQADGGLGGPAAMDAFAAGVAAVTTAVLGATAGHARDSPPLPRKSGNHRTPALELARVGLKMRQRDRAQLTLQLRRGADGKVVASARNEDVLSRLEVVGKDIRARMQLHKRLMRAEVRRIIRVRARREEALLRWDAHSAAVNLRRHNDGSFMLRGKPIIPVSAGKRFRSHISKLLQRLPGPPIPALIMLLASVHAAGAVAAAPAQLTGALPPVQYYNATHGTSADWARYWEVRTIGLESAKEGICARVHNELAQLDVAAHTPFLNIWSVPSAADAPADFQSQVAGLQAFSASLRARQLAALQEGDRRCRALDDAFQLDRAEQATHRNYHGCSELFGSGRHLYAALRDSCPPLVVQTGSAASIAIGLTAPMRDAAPPPGPLYIPHAEGGYLRREVTPQDVYAVLFPPAKSMPHCCITGRCPAPGAPSACPSCAKFNAALAAWDPDDIRSVAPEFPTQLHTGKSGGLDGTVAEIFRWLRPRDEGRRLEFRLKICKLLALYFTSFLRQGKVPASFKEGLCTAILKSVKAGKVDPADPDYYRFITVAGVMPKLFGCVLLTRLSHWSDRTGLTSDSQNAFRAGRNCEQHVISLIELLRARKRGGRATWALFVDFRKAYDSVDHAALWEVMRRAGVPPEIVILLREWNTGRTARLAVNGEVTDPFDITIGVPQGDVLSPWLFNLFVESLIRTIRADATFTGVCEFGITVKELMYADDLSMLCTSRQQAERALEIVNFWCHMWGMRINTGAGKTEVLVFGEVPPAGGWRPLRVGQLVVSVVSEYRYLGLEVNLELDYKPLIERYANKMWTNFVRFFRSNAYVRHMTLRAQVIQLRTFVMSAATFLAAALPAHTPELAAAMDTRVLDMLANLLRLDRNVINGALLQEGNTPSTMFTWVRERTRVYGEALSPATHNPGILLHRILLRQTAPAFRHPDTFVAQTELMFANAGLHPLPCQGCHGYHAGGYVATAGGSLAPTSPEIKRQAAAVARLIATRHWTALSLRRMKSVWTAERWLERPAAAGKQSEFGLWRNCGFLEVGPEWAGPYKHTPMSFTAPGGSGNIICNADIPVAMAMVLLQARQGSAAHKHFRPDAPSAACEHGKPHGPLVTPLVCLACNAPSGDPYHYLFECTHAICVVAQGRAQKLLRDCVSGIVARVRDMAEHRQVPQVAAAPMLRCADAVSEALLLMDATQWASPAGRATLARLSFVHPWSARHVPGSVLLGTSPADCLARGLGRLFDSINWPPCITRNLCTQWAFKASKAQRICNEARDATHPGLKALRRGGAAEHNAAEGDRLDLAAAAEAAADARTAAARGVAGRRVPLPPNGPRRRSGRTAVPRDPSQRLVSEFFSSDR